MSCVQASSDQDAAGHSQARTSKIHTGIQALGAPVVSVMPAGM